MKVLVTGGAGFIGSHVVDRLMQRGDEVIVLDDLSTGSLKNIEHHMSKPNFRFIEGDIRDLKAVGEATAGVDVVIHEAAITSVPLSIEKPELTMDVNVGGTLNLLKASLKARVRRFVYASSSAIYGVPSKLPIDEDSQLKPLSPYGQSKVEAERHCQTFHNRGLETVRLRYFNVYGPRQAGGEYAVVMIKFIERLRNDQPPVIFGDGEQTRDFIFVGDVVEATLLTLCERGAAGECFNVGTGEVITINRLCDLFLKAFGRADLKPIHAEAKPGDIRHSQADITKARRVLGFQPKVSLKEGIRKLIGV